MARARPFRTSTLQDLSNDIKNTLIWGVLTLAIAFWVFRSPKGLPSPIFGSVSGDLTLPSKWGCDNDRDVCLNCWMLKFHIPNNICENGRSLNAWEAQWFNHCKTCNNFQMSYYVRFPLIAWVCYNTIIIIGTTMVLGLWTSSLYTLM